MPPAPLDKYCQIKKHTMPRSCYSIHPWPKFSIIFILQKYATVTAAVERNITVLILTCILVYINITNLPCKYTSRQNLHPSHVAWEAHYQQHGLNQTLPLYPTSIEVYVCVCCIYCIYYIRAVRLDSYTVTMLVGVVALCYQHYDWRY